MLQATTVAGQINGLHTCQPGYNWVNGTKGTKAEHGYCEDAYNDCYGFVRRVWNPFIAGFSATTRKAAGMGTLTAMPVNDYPDSKWAPITNPALLKAGDALATAQGHEWGNWHGGLFYSDVNTKSYNYKDNENQGATSVAVRNNLAWWNGFHYYYKPVHYLLLNN